MRRALAAAALVAAILSAPTPAPGVDMACASHNEWDQVTVGLTAPQIRNLIDGDGHSGDFSKPGQYGIWWPLCWRADKVGVVWFDNVSDLSVDKNIVLPPP